MKATQKCPKCGTESSGGAFDGLCPACMVQIMREMNAASARDFSLRGTIRYFGDYESLEEIARGGMGIVFKARQVSLNRIVALKMILGGQLASPASVQRFHTEAEAAANVKHPNIVAIHEVGEHEGHHYFSMDYIEGQNLAEWMRQGPVPLKKAVACIKTIADAVHYAHQRGILHRDLKPSNILIDVQGQPHVTDFGLAKLLEHDGMLTQSESVMGTPSYMAPEQAAGRTKQLTTASDIYSLGTILYELLTAQPPFRASTPLETMHQVMEREPPPPRRLNPEVDRDLETICLKCLNKDPNARYSSAAALANDLTHWQNGEPIHARPVGRPEKLWRWCRRKPALAAAAGGAVLLLLVILIGSPVMNLRIARQRERAEAQTQRAQTALTRVEIDRAESMFAADSPTRAIAYLARLLRQAPTNRVVTERLLSALSSRNFCLPSAPPLRHSAKVNCAQFSPDGQLVVTASQDGTARIWESRTGHPVGEALRHAAEIKWAQFSPDSHRVVTASLDGTARVWDAQTARPISPPLRHDGAVLCADFSSDGHRVVTGSMDKKLRFWDAETGVPIAPAIRTKAEVYFVRYSPDGNDVLAVIDDRTARIFSCVDGSQVASFPNSRLTQFPQYSPRNGENLVTLQSGEAVVWNIRGKRAAVHLPHRDNPVSATFSADGKLVATASLDNTARVWNLRTGEPVTPPLKHDDSVSSVQFNPDGTLLLTGAMDKTARVWDVRTGKPITEPLQHGSYVRTAQFSPDGERVLTLADGNEALVWWVRSTRTAPLLLKHGHDVRHAVFSPDGHQVATASWDRTARVWDARTGLPLTKPLKQAGYVRFIRFSPDGQRVATVSDQSEAQIWDATTGEPLVKPDKRCTTRWLYNLQFSPDGRRIAMATFGACWIWDTASGEVVCQIQPGGDVYHCMFSPDGQRVVTASNPGSCRVADANTGRVLTDLLPNDDKIEWAEFSPDGNRVITASRNKIVRILDARTGQMLTKPLIHPDLLGHNHSVQFSPDGRRVVTAAGKAVQVWDALNGEPLSPRMEHRGRVSSVRFSPDGKRLITAVFGDDSRVWDAATGHPLSEPLRHREGCRYAEFSPDGESVVTASADGTAAIWWIPLPPMPAPDWLPDLAEALAGRKMDDMGNSEVVPVENLFRLKQRLDGNAERESTRPEKEPTRPRIANPKALAASSPNEMADDGAATYFAVWTRWFFANAAAHAP